MLYPVRFAETKECFSVCYLYYLFFSDPNVDVIFISAVPLSDETLQYYSKLLGLSTAVAKGNPEDQCDMTERYKIIVPEAIKSFPVSHLFETAFFISNMTEKHK